LNADVIHDFKLRLEFIRDLGLYPLEREKMMSECSSVTFIVQQLDEFSIDGSAILQVLQK
jgi:hypothetical protein